MDVEKAREEIDLILAKAKALTSGVDEWWTVMHMADNARCALDGECGEAVWVAEHYAVSLGKCIWCVRDDRGNVIAGNMDEATARRIARLPVLERAVKATLDHPEIGLSALRAARKQAGQP